MKTQRLSVAAAMLTAAATCLGAVVPSASAAVVLTRVSSDPFNNPTSQHATELEPDTFAHGSTVVGAFQVGRFFNGGASDIGGGGFGERGGPRGPPPLPAGVGLSLARARKPLRGGRRLLGRL